MIKFVFFCLLGVALSQPPPPGMDHILLTNPGTKLNLTGLGIDDDIDKMPEEGCGICKALLSYVIKQLPSNGLEPEVHSKNVLRDACSNISVPSHNCSEFVKTFHPTVEPTKAP